MWNPDQAVTESDAVIAAKNHAIKSLRIVKDGADFYVSMHLNWRKDEVFLSTTRSQKEPRRFKHMGRLIEYIESHYPDVKTLELVLQS